MSLQFYIFDFILESYADKLQLLFRKFYPGSEFWKTEKFGGCMCIE